MEGQNTDTRVQIVFISPEVFILSTISKYKPNFSYIVPFSNIDTKRGIFWVPLYNFESWASCQLKEVYTACFFIAMQYIASFSRYHEANSSVTPVNTFFLEMSFLDGILGRCLSHTRLTESISLSINRLNLM